MDKVQTWKKLVLTADETVGSAMEILDKEKPKIVLVVDGVGRLIGTVTDGDIRRALLRNCQLTTRLDEIMNAQPRVASGNQDAAMIEEFMKAEGLKVMPSVDADNMLVGLYTVIVELSRKQIFHNPVLLMAGGFGTRLLPLTRDTPKPLLHIHGKPILERILDSLILSGFCNFYVSVHYKAEMVKDYFGNGDRWNVSIEYIEEKVPLGTAGALALLPGNLPDLPIVVVNGDVLTSVDLKLMTDFHSREGGIASIGVVDYEFEVPFGVIEESELQVTRIVEKPTHKFFVSSGIYVFDKKVTEQLDSSKRIDIPNLINQLVEQGEKVNVFPIHEYWMDIGRLDQYEQAKVETYRYTNDQK